MGEHLEWQRMPLQVPDSMLIAKESHGLVIEIDSPFGWYWTR